MKVLLVVVLSFAGCAFFSETQQPDTMPQLVYRTPLPAVPADWATTRPKIEVLFHISKTGAVEGAHFINPTGDDNWESRALTEMMQWRYSPARFGQDSVPVWIRVPVNVIFTDTKMLNLSELVCVNKTCADSAYLLLLAGHPFESIVQELPSVSTGTYEKRIGETDIRIFTEEVQRELARLEEDGFTKPIRIGSSFVIFKRMRGKQVSGL